MPKKNKSAFNLTKKEYLKAIARETARMSAPGSFYGRVLKDGKKSLKDQAPKSKVEGYFQSKFPIESLWNKSLTNGNTFDEWHKKRVEDLDKIIKNHINQPKNGTKRVAYAISAKLLNTFMHQLMKYKEFRYLYKYLHLPLDGQVFKNLARELKEIENPQSLKELRDLAQKYENKAYTLDYNKYKEIQGKLNCLQKYLNKVLKSEGIKLESRVELNCILWPK